MDLWITNYDLRITDKQVKKGLNYVIELRQFFCTIYFAELKISLILQLEITGAVVQLVRITACHAVGRGFESRPHRSKTKKPPFDFAQGGFCILCH